MRESSECSERDKNNAADQEQEPVDAMAPEAKFTIDELWLKNRGHHHNETDANLENPHQAVHVHSESVSLQPDYGYSRCGNSSVTRI